MQRMKERSDEEQLVIHEQNNLAPVWETSAHSYRILLARRYIEKAIAGFGRRVTIIDLGVGSGDISGPFSYDHRVIGIDLTEDSVEVCARRYPKLEHVLSRIEDAPAIECDILVACEVLEHLPRPLETYRRFALHAGSVVIGHPLNEPDPSTEYFHLWRYDEQDFANWFTTSGHHLVEQETFSMGGFPSMILGWGSR